MNVGWSLIGWVLGIAVGAAGNVPPPTPASGEQLQVEQLREVSQMQQEFQQFYEQTLALRRSA